MVVGMWLWPDRRVHSPIVDIGVAGQTRSDVCLADYRTCVGDLVVAIIHDDRPVCSVDTAHLRRMSTFCRQAGE